MDELLLRRGFAKEISRAISLILSGSVLVNDRVVDKVGISVAENSEIRIRDIIPKYVSRGAYKLKAAIEKWDIDLKGKLCMDWGASTGGFTQVLLEEGAGSVFAFDVGYGQMASKIAMNPKVIVRDRFHIKETSWNLLHELWKTLSDSEFPKEIFLVMDLSFISLEAVLPTIARLKAENPSVSWKAVSLFKPQFETEARYLEKGVLKDSVMRLRVLRWFLRFLRKKIGGKLLGLSESPITGRDGNREILVYWEI